MPTNEVFFAFSSTFNFLKPNIPYIEIAAIIVSKPWLFNKMVVQLSARTQVSESHHISMICPPRKAGGVRGNPPFFK